MTTATAVRIELDSILDAIVGPQRLLAGDLTGEDARREAQLDYHDLQDYPVEIVIPARVISVNSSFLRGFIRPSIFRLGEDRFREKYSFTGPDFSAEIEDEIGRAVLQLQRAESRAAA
ncbi:MAG TPA: hypothetical protein VGC13_04375 [Longimicrobium sp.]|jgi:hypothetical protein|uniref:hypothetical protein n=1 Tax=Longimicrobium sp. TaxID=2029185 RepID=UPI002EDAEC17